MNKLIRLLPLLFLYISFVIQAAEQLPAWYHPDVVKALLEIGLDEEQSPKFKAAVSQYLADLPAMINKVMRGNNQTGIPRQIKSKNRRLVKKMDSTVAEFMTDEQIARYENYRDILLRELNR